MNRKIISVLFLTYFFLYGFSQPAPIIDFQLNLINENDFFFNRQFINPSFVNDSSKFQADVISHEKWVANPSEPFDQVFLINHKLACINSSVGVISKFTSNSIYDNQIYKLNYIKTFELSDKSKIKLGINFGFSRLKLESDNSIVLNSHPYYIFSPYWSNNINLDLGFTYTYLNHNVGVSFLDIFEPRFYIYNISSPYIHRSLLVSYSPIIKINETFKLVPEIIFIKNSEYHNFVINAKILFKNKFTAGLIYDNRFTKNYGLMVSGILFKYMDFGYIFDLSLPNQSNRFGYHSLKLGIIIK